MKFKITLLFLFVSSFQFLRAQEIKAQSQSFLIKGKVQNNQQASWRFGITSYFDKETIAVPIQSNGAFSQKIPVEGMQDIYLLLNNDAIAFYVQPGDTIEVNWDEQDFEKTFEIKSSQVYRTKDLQLNWKLYKTFRKDVLSLRQKLSEERNKADSVRYRWINDLYNQELKTILSDTTSFSATTEKFASQTYYRYVGLLFSEKLLTSFPLLAKEAIVNPYGSALAKHFIPAPLDYKVEYDKTFYECPEYRDFLFDYIRFPNKSITGWKYSHANSIDQSSPGFAWDDYYNGMANLKLLPIRDWYITTSIIFSFGHYSFQESEEVLNTFLPKCKTQKYKDVLIKFYAYIKSLQPGTKAPNFTLKGEDGKAVSLSDFKGKLVYIDFWGVGCGPCIYDIKNYVPKLHEQYHGKDVVFINICVDANEKSWKKFLSKTKVDGINLLAEGRREDKVCKAYNIDGIPHYILIDRQGRIVDNNAPRPGELLSAQKNAIDKLLSNK